MITESEFVPEVAVHDIGVKTFGLRIWQKVGVLRVLIIETPKEFHFGKVILTPPDVGTGFVIVIEKL
jgi:hypothetical protein